MSAKTKEGRRDEDEEIYWRRDLRVVRFAGVESTKRRDLLNVAVSVEEEEEAERVANAAAAARADDE